MNKKIKLNKIKDTSSEEQRFGVFVEHMDGKFEKVFEGHIALDKRIDDLDNKVDNINKDLSIFKSDVATSFGDMASSFRTVMEHLSGIEEDLKSIKRVEDLERRFNLLESKLKEKHFV